jgi:hypothetical protein
MPFCAAEISGNTENSAKQSGSSREKETSPMKSDAVWGDYTSPQINAVINVKSVINYGNRLLIKRNNQKKMVHQTGVEPVTSAFGGRRSIQLSYWCPKRGSR